MRPAGALSGLSLRSRATGMGYEAPLTLLREIFCVLPLAKMPLTWGFIHARR